MKKLLLVPVVVMTGLLAFAFLMPATASTVLRALAPAAHLSVPLVLHAGSQNETAAKPAESPANVGSSGGPSSPRGSGSTLQGSTSQPSISVNDRGHAVATAGKVNCGRFGNGTHGGKHDFTCPNQPFPVPAS
jgi:hypothetical protein